MLLENSLRTKHHRKQFHSSKESYELHTTVVSILHESTRSKGAWHLLSN